MAIDTEVPQGAAAWAARAGELADWAWHRLVNRTDAWGAYRPVEESGREYPRPDGTRGKLGEQRTVRKTLTRDVLLRHFGAQARSAIMGLHTAGQEFHGVLKMLLNNGLWR